jgi:hypothetical protein
MPEAQRLKKLFEYVAARLGLQLDAVITDGRQPIGRGIGPVLEARDVMSVLNNDPDAPHDLRQKALRLAGRVIEFDPDVRGGDGYRIARDILESGRALVLAFNKWDLLDDDRRRYLEREIDQDLAHVAWAPRVNISARTGRHMEKLVPALELALRSWDTRIATGKFNAFLSELTAAHPHPVRGGKQPRILFGTQASTRPPTFVLFTTGFLDPGYRRYITRRLREIYGFEGSPVQVNMRVREKRKR